MTTWMPWLLSATGVLGMVLAGRKLASGWAVGILSEALWLMYTVQTEQWGFVAGVVCYSAAFAWNYRSWTKETVCVSAPVTS